MSRMMARELGGGLAFAVAALAVALKYSWRRVFTYSAGYYIVVKRLGVREFICMLVHLMRVFKAGPICLQVVYRG